MTAMKVKEFCQVPTTQVQQVKQKQNEEVGKRHEVAVK